MNMKEHLLPLDLSTYNGLFMTLSLNKLIIWDAEADFLTKIQLITVAQSEMEPNSSKALNNLKIRHPSSCSAAGLAW